MEEHGLISIRTNRISIQSEHPACITYLALLVHTGLEFVLATNYILAKTLIIPLISQPASTALHYHHLLLGTIGFCSFTISCIKIHSPIAYQWSTLLVALYNSIDKDRWNTSIATVCTILLTLHQGYLYSVAVLRNISPWEDKDSMPKISALELSSLQEQNLE